MTKRQQRAEKRMEHARIKKVRRTVKFANKVAARRLKDPEDARQLVQGFCCKPRFLEMRREEFLSKGLQLVGGTAVLFDRGVLMKLLPNWECANRSRPAVLMAANVRENYQEDGFLGRDDRYREREERSRGTSGSSLHWT